jgi:alanine dehydrogenase
VSVQPDGVAELVYNGHRSLVEAGAGLGSRFTDAEYAPPVPMSSIRLTRYSPRAT